MSAQDNLPVLFVLAHELAHHVKEHVFKGRDKRWEDEADRLAAQWVTVLRRRAASGETVSGPEIYDRLIGAFRALELKDDGFHPSACEREGDIAQGYNDARAILKDEGLPAKNPIKCRVCLAYNSDTRGFLTQRSVEKGVPLVPDDVSLCPGGPSELPNDFRRDIQGMCPIAGLDVATRLTWENMTFAV